MVYYTSMGDSAARKKHGARAGTRGIVHAAADRPAAAPFDEPPSWSSRSTSRSRIRIASSKLLQELRDTPDTPPVMTNPANRTIQDICDAILQRQRFVVTSHARPDGDAIGSQLALAYALKALGKSVRCVDRDPAPPQFLPFPGVSDIHVASTSMSRPTR